MEIASGRTWARRSRSRAPACSRRLPGKSRHRYSGACRNLPSAWRFPVLKPPISATGANRRRAARLLAICATLAVLVAACDAQEAPRATSTPPVPGTEARTPAVSPTSTPAAADIPTPTATVTPTTHAATATPTPTATATPTPRLPLPPHRRLPPPLHPRLPQQLRLRKRPRRRKQTG